MSPEVWGSWQRPFQPEPFNDTMDTCGVQECDSSALFSNPPAEGQCGTCLTNDDKVPDMEQPRNERSLGSAWPDGVDHLSLLTPVNSPPESRPSATQLQKPGEENALKPGDTHPVFLVTCCAISSKQHYLSASVQLSERSSVLP